MPSLSDGTVITNDRTPIECCSCGKQKTKLRCITIKIWKFERTVGWFCNECCVKSKIEKLFEKAYSLIRNRLIKRKPKGLVRKSWREVKDAR